VKTLAPRKCIIPKRNKFIEIDSFVMFKNKEQIDLLKAGNDRTAFMIPRYELTAILQDDNSFQVQFLGCVYTIKVERKPTNFGGHYYFFHCPKCELRVRKLYCIDGLYLCRKKKCANLGFLSQKLNPYDRLLYMQRKIERELEQKSGSLDRKPPWMKQRTFESLQQKYEYYDHMYFEKAEVAFIKKYPASKTTL